MTDIIENQETKEEDLLERAVRIAHKMHQGQTDKSGMDYIKHPMRVADALAREDEKIVAWLHDVVEDTTFSMTDLVMSGFPERIIEAVDAISKRRGEREVDYIERVRKNPLARAVKLEDIRDNMGPERFDKLGERDRSRLEKKYHVALEHLAEGRDG